jgi:predicted dehydrogenase
MLRASILGLGKWGRRLVESVQSRSDEIRFVGAVTATPEKSRDFAAAHGIALYPSLAELLEANLCEAVVIATPHSQHAEQACACAAAGRAVFVEKPVALTVREFDMIATAAAASRVVLAAGHNRRFLPAVVTLLRSVAQGRIGRVLHMEGHLSAPVGHDYRNGTWRASERESPAGGLAGAGIHIIDLMVALVGPGASVYAQADRLAISAAMDDTTSALLKFRGGASGYVGAVTASAPTFQFRVFGSAGMMGVRDDLEFETVDLDGTRDIVRFDRADTERLELEAFARASMRQSSSRFPWPRSGTG